MTRVPILEPEVLRETTAVLADTSTGLSNREIDDLLSSAGIADANPPLDSPHFYRVIRSPGGRPSAQADEVA